MKNIFFGFIFTLPLLMKAQDFLSPIDIEYLEDKVVELVSSDETFSPVQAIHFWEDTIYKRFVYLTPSSGYSFYELDFPIKTKPERKSLVDGRNIMRHSRLDSILISPFTTQSDTKFLIVELSKDVLLSGEKYFRLGFDHALYKIPLSVMRIKNNEVYSVCEYVCSLVVYENKSTSISCVLINKSKRAD